MKLFYPLLILLICCFTRADYKHWIDEDGDCQNTRTEILIERNEGKLVYKGCKIVSGKWLNEYTGTYLYKSKDIDLDHMVALSEADKGGASKWSKKNKMLFANDSENLVITDAHNNRSKSDKSPDKWLPKVNECAYLKKREYIIKKYKLKNKIYSCK
jgi:hypothetical protein